VYAERARLRQAHEETASRAFHESERIRGLHAAHVHRSEQEAERLRNEHLAHVRRTEAERLRLDQALARARSVAPTSERSLLDLHLPKAMEEAVLIALTSETNPRRLRRFAALLVRSYPAAASVLAARAKKLEAPASPSAPAAPGDAIPSTTTSGWY
jgi:hypothetical protein